MGEPPAALPKRGGGGIPPGPTLGGKVDREVDLIWEW